MIDIDAEEFSVPAEFWSSDYLYHYTSIQTAIESIIFTGSLRLGPFSNTTDPFEYNEIKIGVGIGVTTPEEDTYKRKIGHSAAQLLAKEFESYRFISFCCSAEEPGNFDKLGLLKQRMWSQYGNNHSGACLVFSKERIKDILASKGLTVYSEKIRYVGFDYGFWTYPAIDVPDGINQDENDLFEMHLNRYRDEYFFTKHLDYRDEDELRIIISCPNEKYYFFKFIDSLRAIIISDRVDEYHQEQAIKYAEELNVPLLSLSWYFRSPGIYRVIRK